MRLIPLLAVAILTPTAFAQPRQPQPLARGSSAIRGVLTDSVTNEPIPHCTVRINTIPRAAPPPRANAGTTTTASDGAFEFAGIEEGTYFVAADCPAHLMSCNPVGANGGPPCSPLTIFKDQHQNVDFKLTLGAIIRGKVVDSAGRPVANTGVRVGGMFLANQVVMIQTVMTTDDGGFELPRLPDGDFAIEVDVPPAPGALRSPLVYYPGVLSREEAGRVEVRSGRVREGVVITIPPVLERSITVRVPPPDGTMSDMNVFLIRGEPLMSRRLDIDTDGQAIVKGLIAGRYVVVATATSGQERWADFMTVDFHEESVDVALQPRPAGRIRGRIVLEGGGVPQIGDATIGAAWVDDDVLLNPLSADEGAVAADGTFEISGIFGRRKLQLERFDAGWRIHAVMQGKSDVTERGVDVVPNGTAEVTVILKPR